MTTSLTPVTFATKTDFSTGNNTVIQSVISSDFNNDGKIDLITKSRNVVSILLGDGNGGFTSSASLTVGTYLESINIGDVNADGKIDLIAGDYYQILIALGDGKGGFSMPTSFQTGAGINSFVSIGDFNGDGNVDLVSADASGSGKLSTLLGDGQGGFSSQLNFAIGDPRWVVKVADFNNDNKADLVTVNAISNTISVLLGDGLGKFSSPTSFSVGSYPQSVTIADFNSDGKVDIATANVYGNSVSVLLGDGQGSFTAQTAFSVTDYPTSVNVGDFNADGQMDIVTANLNSNNISVLSGDGLGNFPTSTSFSVGAYPYSVSVADFNSDSKLDLATANYTGKNVSTLLNTTGTVSNTTTPNHAPTGSPIFVQAATYTLSVDKFNVNEGDTVNLSLQTTNVAAGMVVPITFGGSINNADTASGLNSPSFFVGTDGTAKLAVTFINDKLTEGMENLTATLQNVPNQTVSVNVNDTSVKPANNPPTGNVIINGDAKVGQTVTVQNNVQDLDGVSVFNFQWFSNGAIINGKTQPNYTPTNDDVNKNISVQVSYTDGLGNFEKVSSTPLFVQAATPTYSLNVDKFNVNEGDTVNLSLQTTNVAAGMVVPITFGGSINNADTASGLNSPSFFVGTDGTAKLAVTFINDKLTEGMENLTATLQNVPNQTVSVNVNDTSVKPANNPPTGNVIINGDAKVGQTVTVQNNVQDLDGVSVFNFQWFSNGAIINGKTQPNYTPTNDDVNKNISVQVSYTDGLGNFEKVSSTPLFVQAATPTYSLNVDKFNVNEGDTVNLSLQTTNVPANTAVNVNVSGSATAADLNGGYIPNSFFVGADGKATIPLSFLKDKITEGTENLTFILSNDSSKFVTINVNDPMNNPPTGNVLINGDAKVGQTLTVQNNVQDLDGVGAFNFQWFSNGAIINGKTQPNYTPINDDVNKNISVQVSYTDGLGNFEKVSSSPIFVQAATPTYALSVDRVNVNEGESVYFKITTTNVPIESNIDFPLTFSGSISSADVDNQMLLPRLLWIDKNSTGTIAVSFSNDKLTEGKENLIARLINDASKSVTVNVNDTSVTEIVNNPPTGNVVIQGIAKVGTKLSLLNTLDDADGLGAFSYQWLSNGVAIKNATKETYNPSKTDVGKKISVTVSYTDDLDNAEFQTSGETTAIKASIIINGFTKIGDANKNKLIGAEKNDSLSGMAGADTLLGNAGDDQLDGGAGNDSLDGGNGNDELTGSDGNDTLLGGSGNDSLDGGKGDDKLTGDAGNDTLNGGVGADKLDGGAGNDYYVVDNLKDTVTETDANVKLGGNDSVETALSYTLGKNIENLILAGIIDNNGTGNELNNQITGNVGDNFLKGMAGNDKLVGGSGADTLDGGLGMDTLTGGADDDTYYMNNTEDKIIEAKNGGEDQIIASVDFDLNTSPNVEILILSGVKAINGTGNEFNNLLQEIDGGNVANVFDGQAGNDTINGGGGDDTLEGGDGNDVIDGGNGNDVAIFSGAKDDYQIMSNADATEFVVSYQGNDDSILDGEDILTNVENLQFSDGNEIYSIADLILTGVIS